MEYSKDTIAATLLNGTSKDCLHEAQYRPNAVAEYHKTSDIRLEPVLCHPENYTRAIVKTEKRSLT